MAARFGPGCLNRPDYDRAARFGPHDGGQQIGLVECAPHRFRIGGEGGDQIGIQVPARAAVGFGEHAPAVPGRGRQHGLFGQVQDAPGERNLAAARSQGPADLTDGSDGRGGASGRFGNETVS
ncbi:hypothetical protein [Nocardia sp. NPDC056000]|uniref:hypothetical protein n=1 Tax=Nocardia sp. NPDC056000 TaxID=3345674 RepID=UPI0035DBC2F7